MEEEVQGFKRVPREVMWRPREAVFNGCELCMVGEAMEQFVIEGKDHICWDAGSCQFIKSSPQDPPLMFLGSSQPVIYCFLYNLQ